jgi:hypothetical protein
MSEAGEMLEAGELPEASKKRTKSIFAVNTLIYEMVKNKISITRKVRHNL